MADTLQMGKTRWCHYQTAYHFVWIPKYRRRVLTGEVQVAAKATIVGLLKGHSSRQPRAQFPVLKKRCGKESLWTSAYYVGTAEAVSAAVVRRYITECQGK